MHPIFSDRTNFNPETFADYGWEHAPAKFESEEETRALSEYSKLVDQDPEVASLYLEFLTAKDRVVSLSEMEEAGIAGFEKSKSFPDGLDSGNSDENQRMVATIAAIKEIHETAVFTRNGEPCNGSVVKLAGRQIYLITPEENKNELQFDSLPDNELFKYFQKTWKDHINKTNPEEFEKHTLQTLRTLLPEIDTNLNVLRSILEAVSTTDLTPDRAFRDSAQTLIGRIIEFKLLYQELILKKKHMEFYQGVRDKFQEMIDWLEGAVRLPVKKSYERPEKTDFTFLLIPPADTLEESEDPFKKMVIEDSKKKKANAESKLQGLHREITKIRLKIVALSELPILLARVADPEKIYSEVNDIDAGNKKKSLFENVNKMLGLIRMNKISINSDYSRNIEALHLAVENEFPNLGNTTEQSPVSGSLAPPSQTMPVILPTSQVMQKSYSEELLNTDLRKAGYSSGQSSQIHESLANIENKAEIPDINLLSICEEHTSKADCSEKQTKLHLFGIEVIAPGCSLKRAHSLTALTDTSHLKVQKQN